MQNGQNGQHVFAEMDKKQQQLQIKPMTNNLYINKSKEAVEQSHGNHQEISHHKKMDLKVNWEQDGHESNQ